MKENDQGVATLNDLLHYNARIITDAEIELKNILHSWVNTAASLKLKEVLMRYADHIHKHIDKMENFFTEEKVFPLTPGNRVMNVLIRETGEKMSLCSEAELRDACLLASVQEINHYKISLYGTAASFANMLEMNDSAVFFHEAEISEKQIDDRLSQLAEHEINSNAKATALIAK
jgi:ferritin-like metal-binding protein YciE